MVVDHVLELGREVDLGAFVVGELVEELGGERRGAVLDRPGEAVFFPRDPRDRPQGLEVDRDPLHRSVAVRRRRREKSPSGSRPSPGRGLPRSAWR